MEEGVVDLYFFAGTGVLQAFDDDTVAGLEAAGDDPAIVLHRAQLHRLFGDAHLLVDGQHLGNAGAVTLHGTLRYGDTVLDSCLLEAHANETARQQVEIRVGEFAAQNDLASARVDGDVAEQQLARQRIQAAVILNQRGFDLILADFLQLPGAKRTAQFIEFTGRLGEVGVNRIELLNQCQRRGFVLPDQCAFGHQCAANTPGNRCSDGGITEVQFCALDGSLVGRNVSGSLSGIGAGVVVVLAANGLVIDQLGIALLLQFCLERIGFCLAQCGFGAVEVSLERRRVDAEQHIALFHVTAFAEGALQDHTGYPCPHFGDTWRGDAAAEFAADRQGMRFDRLDAHRGRWRLILCLRGRITAAQCQRHRDQAEPGQQFIRHVQPQY